MRRFFCASLFLFLPVLLNAQADSAALAEAIRTSANNMMNAFKLGDFRTFVKYNNANLVAQMGGEEEFTKYMETEMKAMQGVEFSEMRAGKILRLLKDVQPMQCIIEQYSEIKVNNTPVSSVSHLIGISGDSGKTWRFMDANTGTREEIKTALPELNPVILIPRKKQETGVTLDRLLSSYQTTY